MNRIWRQLLLVPVLALGVALFTYALLDFLPGDPARTIVGEGASRETVQSVREQLGLNAPLPNRLADYVAGLVHGDLGQSFQTHRAVSSDLWAVMPKTLELALLAEAAAIVVGFAVGALAALRFRRIGTGLLMTGSAVALSLPLFALALLLQLAFAVYLGWLPPSGTGGIFSAHIVLPVLACAIPSAGFIARFARTTVAERMQDEHVQTAIAKGLRTRVIVGRHILRPATGTLVSVVAADLSRLLGGVAMVEIIFGWPGVGKYAFDALVHRDLPALQGALLLITLAVLLTNQLAELAYRLVDPRIGARDH
jgi:peptide/nickel transport system permease protein